MQRPMYRLPGQRFFGAVCATRICAPLAPSAVEAGLAPAWRILPPLLRSAEATEETRLKAIAETATIDANFM